MTLKVNEIFSSIQGEGRWMGWPALFIRLSGCTRSCSFCDSKYHTTYTKISIDNIVKKITQSNKQLVIWTGGNPTIQLKEIQKVIFSLSSMIDHHIECNGDLIKNKKDLEQLSSFNYICVSPKDFTTAKRIHRLMYIPYHKFSYYEGDIKVVTDLNKINIKLIPYATCLQPLTTGDKIKDNMIKRKVWNYCIKKDIFYSARLHIETWGPKKRAI